MRYFFECGNFPDISLAELSILLEAFNVSKDSIKKGSESILFIDSNSITKEILDTVFKRAGSFIRYGEVIENVDTFLLPYFDMKKVVYGISVLGYSDIKIKDIQRLSNEIKRGFKESGVSSRFILPQKGELNAAQIIYNEILSDGFELCIFDINGQRVYGNTLGIQDIDSFVKRDLERPSVDFDMGVLPQKLARIMCNLTGLRSGILWDPFCGSGTVLMEAAVLGFDILGSDIDLGALESADKNIKWLSKEGLIESNRYNIFQLDIRNVEKRIIKDLKSTGINAVVCEPFMGPPQRRVVSEFKAEELLENVRSLYESLFTVLNEISHKGFKVVLIVPEYKTDRGWKTFNLNSLIGKKWNILNKKYGSGDLKWKRINSIISRNIFILEKR